MSSNKRKEMSPSADIKDKKEQDEKGDSSSDEEDDDDLRYPSSSANRPKKAAKKDYRDAWTDQLELAKQCKGKNLLIIVQGMKSFDCRVFRVPVEVLFKDLDIKDVVDLGDPETEVISPITLIVNETILIPKHRVEDAFLVTMRSDVVLLRWLGFR